MVRIPGLLLLLFLLGVPLIAQVIGPLERIPVNRTLRIGPGGTYRCSL